MNGQTLPLVLFVLAAVCVTAGVLVDIRAVQSRILPGLATASGTTKVLLAGLTIAATVVQSDRGEYAHAIIALPATIAIVGFVVLDVPLIVKLRNRGVQAVIPAADGGADGDASTPRDS